MGTMSSGNKMKPLDLILILPATVLHGSACALGLFSLTASLTLYPSKTIEMFRNQPGLPYFITIMLAIGVGGMLGLLSLWLLILNQKVRPIPILLGLLCGLLSSGFMIFITLANDKFNPATLMSFGNMYFLLPPIGPIILTVRFIPGLFKLLIAKDRERKTRTVPIVPS